MSAAWPALSLRAGNDGVAKAADVEGGMTRLPTGSQLVTIDGSVHAFFGRYGPQAGDGVPTVARAVAEQAIINGVTRYVAALA